MGVCISVWVVGGGCYNSSMTIHVQDMDPLVASGSPRKGPAMRKTFLCKDVILSEENNRMLTTAHRSSLPHSIMIPRVLDVFHLNRKKADVSNTSCRFSSYWHSTSSAAYHIAYDHFVSKNIFLTKLKHLYLYEITIISI